MKFAYVNLKSDTRAVVAQIRKNEWISPEEVLPIPDGYAPVIFCPQEEIPSAKDWFIASQAKGFIVIDRNALMNYNTEVYAFDGAKYSAPTPHKPAVTEQEKEQKL